MEQQHYTDSSPGTYEADGVGDCDLSVSLQRLRFAIVAFGWVKTKQTKCFT